MYNKLSFIFQFTINLHFDTYVIVKLNNISRSNLLSVFVARKILTVLTKTNGEGGERAYFNLNVYYCTDKLYSLIDCFGIKTLKPSKHKTIQ